MEYREFLRINSPNLDFSDGIDAYYVTHDGNADNNYVIGRNSYEFNSPDYGNDYVSYYIEDTGYAYTDVWVYTHSFGQPTSPYFINHDYKACYVYDDGSDGFEVSWDSYGDDFTEIKTPSTC